MMMDQMNSQMGEDPIQNCNYKEMVNSLAACLSSTVVKFPEVVSCNNRQFSYKLFLSSEQYDINIFQFMLAYKMKERNIKSNQFEEPMQLANK